ncbi:SH3 domain-containing protein [Brucella anthropi]|uniref:SH3 domain-containing protein n=1 Tax=Brucella anthropi TaxID=529 RepID=UPI000288BCE7|nr:SH3 domain-containing protein [Brucella anthropi]
MKALLLAFSLSIITVTANAAPAITTGNVHLRTGPGTGYQTITTLPAGSKVNLRRCVSSWCQVRALGTTGWVSARYVSRSVTGGPTIIISPVIRPPHYRPPHYRPPHRPRPPGHRPPKCKIAPGFPCPR